MTRWSFLYLKIQRKNEVNSMKQMKNITVRVLNKMFAAGIDTDKKVPDLKIEDVLAMPNITVGEIKEVTGIQRALKAKRMISYLSGVSDLTEQKEQVHWLIAEEEDDGDDLPFS